MKLGMARFLSYGPTECTRSFGIGCAAAISKSNRIKSVFLGPVGRQYPLGTEIFSI